LKFTVGYAGGNPFSLIDAAGNPLFTFIPTRAAYYFVYSSPTSKMEQLIMFSLVAKMEVLILEAFTVVELSMEGFREVR
jgi:hypothetical protein